MPPLCQPESLTTLAIDVACRHLFTKAINCCYVIKWREEDFPKDQELKDLLDVSRLHIHYSVDVLKLQGVERFRAFLSREKNNATVNGMRFYFKPIPLILENQILKKVLTLASKIAVCAEEQIGSFYIGTDLCDPRVKVFSRIWNTMGTHELTTLDLSTITVPHSEMLAHYIMTADVDEDYIRKWDRYRHLYFTKVVREYHSNFYRLTSLSMQNVLSGELLWAICCVCPNLWHLDVSGELFDLEAYHSLAKRDPDDSLIDHFKYRHYFDALSGLYGNHGFPKNGYEGIPEGCPHLKTLYLPEVRWTRFEEHLLEEELVFVLKNNRNLEELTGVCWSCLLNALQHTDYCPLILRLRKFVSGHLGYSVSHDPLECNKKIHFPFVTEADINFDIGTQIEVLEQFPNLKKLSLCYDFRDYKTHNILPYTKSLQTLVIDLEKQHSISMSDICSIAENCPWLESFTLSNSALRKKAFMSTLRQSDALSLGDIDMKPQNGCEQYETKPSSLLTVQEYVKTLLQVDTTPYEKDSSCIPKFLRLHTLKLVGINSIDTTALYKCIRGSPNIQILTAVLKKTNDCNTFKMDNNFVRRIAPLLKHLKHLTLGAVDASKYCAVDCNLTGIAVEHLVHFCLEIQSIGTMVSWNLTPSEVKAYNEYFKSKNYILRLT